jgi:hypothetical protein
MTPFQPSSYGPVIASILGESRLMPLGPGNSNIKVKSQLQALTVEQAFCEQALQDQDMAKCCLAGLWLYHHFLDESHALIQEIHTITGSYWHGVMHRREPDYANAKYWFRRVGDHPVFGVLRADATQIAADNPSESIQFLTRQSSWDPFAFIDLCEEAAGSPLEMLCRRIQQREWELLFDFCYRQAIHAK